MNILFISSMDYTVGGAAQHRHENIFRELSSKENKVSLINLQNIKNTSFDFNQKNFPRFIGFLPWKMKVLVCFIPMVLMTLLMCERNTIIICLDRNFFVLGASILFAKIFNFKIFHEVTEYPDVVVGSNISGKLTVFLFERFYIKKLDGLIVISRSLIEYVKSRGNSKVFLLPSIVNIKIEEIKSQDVSLLIDFTYMGSLSQEKDGVLDMIEAFNICKNQILDKKMMLNIYGGGSTEELKKIKELVISLNIYENVVLHGYVTKDYLRAVLSKTSVLLHCRPLSRQAKGGFSTKLTEYLATGKPVITTITSDIGRYCIDNKNAFLVPPNDIVLFAEKMAYIVNNLDIAAEVGRKGQILAKEYFSAEKKVAELYAWLKGESQS